MERSASATPYARRVSASATGEFVVAPAPGLILWTVLIGSLLIAGGVTAAKGHWGWVLVGLLTGGLPWFVTALLPAAPDSMWTRRFERPANS